MTDNHRMYIYHFTFDKSCEKKTKGKDPWSTLIVMAATYESALSKVQTHVADRPTFAGAMAEYDINVDWIEESIG